MAEQSFTTKLTEKKVTGFQAKNGKPTFYWHATQPGFGLKVNPGGRKSYVVIVNVDGGPQRRVTIGNTRDWSLDDALKRAQEFRVEGGRGVDVAAKRKAAKVAKQEAEENTVGKVAARFISQHASKLRSGKEVERTLKTYVVDRWKDLPVRDLTRARINALLDDVEAGTASDKQRRGGAVQADRVLAWLSKMLSWHATRCDDFASPVVPGMRRTTKDQRSRDHVLEDHEIRALWECTADGLHGALVRLLLLTAQRKMEVAQMRRGEVQGDTWTVPAERSKNGKPLHVPLSGAALEVLDGLFRDDLVFSHDGERGMNGFSKEKARLDARMAAVLDRAGHEFRPWRLHDLRRTARTLMARADVRPDVAERVLGHTIKGVEAVYDRHHYEAAKRGAARKLSWAVRHAVKGDLRKFEMMLRLARRCDDVLKEDAKRQAARKLAQAGGNVVNLREAG